MRIVAVILSGVLASATALAQQSVAPPPRPPADKPAGPTIEVTMKFIEDKINEIGTVTIAGYVHDSANDTDGVQKISATFSNAVADAGACTLGYHRLVISNGQTAYNENVFANLRDVQSIAVLTDAQDWQMYLARTGDATKTVRDVPEIYVLNIKLPKGVDHPIRFYEQDMADRVAKALVHAVELCGGGSKPEPF